MANYPTGIFAPAAKNTGDVIQAAHVTDLEAEVIAIENALLNGVPHPVTLSSGLQVSTGATVLGGTLSVAGASTVAALTAGASTLASLDVAGNSTFHGPVTFSSAVTFGQAMSLANALHVGSSLTLAGPLRVPSQSTQVGGASTSANELVIADTAVFVLINNNSTAFALGGISGGQHGRVLYVFNAGDAPLTLAHQNAGTPSTSRFWGNKVLSTTVRTATLIYSTLTVGAVSPGWSVV